MKPILQLALDFVDLERALKVAEEAAEYADYLEAGTPLIKSEGLECVRKLKKLYPEKTIVADMKVMDAGRIEVEAAAKAGADIVDVCAQASKETITECVKAASNYGVKVAVDLIGVEDTLAKAKLAQELGADIVAVHTAIDEQMASKTPFMKVEAVADEVSIQVAAAGGLNSESVVDAVKAGASILIIGGAITKSEHPRREAKAIKEAAYTLTASPTKLYKRSQDIRSVLSKVSGANISDAMHRRGELMGLKTVCPSSRAFGQAVTVRTYPGDWSKPVQAIDAANEGDVLVITSGGVGPAVWGELATESALQKKISAVVVDGTVRDSHEIAKLGLPVYARNVSPTAGEPRGLGEINAPIRVSGVDVKPGDWIFCDPDGVVVIPKKDAVEIANRAQDVLERENRIRSEIREGKSSLGKVTHLLKWDKKN